jgi:subtilisin family serine protease
MIKKIISIVIAILLLSTTPLIAGVNIDYYNDTQNNLQNSDDSLLFNSKNSIDILPSSLGDTPSFIPNEMIIAFKADKKIHVQTSSNRIVTTGLSSVDVLNQKYRVLSAEKLLEEDSTPQLSNVYLFTFPNNTNILRVTMEYNRDPTVECAEPNYLYNPCHIPNDPYFPMQWALDNTGQNEGTPGADIHAPEAWDLEQGNPDIVIAILDTGVDYTNPDIGNCTEMVSEQNYSLISPHPINETFLQTVSFPEYDAVSIHLTKFNINTQFFTISNKLKGKLVPKTLLKGYDYQGNATNLWTQYSEYGSGNKINIYALINRSNPSWGFAIDKIRGIYWNPLSELSPKYVDGYDYFYKNIDPMDDMGHGTHCAGIVSAVTDNGYGIAGIAGNCCIMPIKIGGTGLGAVSMSALLRGLVFAVNHGADIISMSFGGIATTIQNLAVSYAAKKGVVLIAAAGNSDMNIKSQSSPAFNKDIIAVAATDANDSRAVFSNYGSWVDVAAPGVDILSLRAHGSDMYVGRHPTYPPGENLEPPFDVNATLYRASGTSMACPMVAGVAALILSKNPQLTPIQVRTILRSSTDKVSSQLYIGTGRINAYTAVLKTAPVTAELDHELDDKEVNGRFDIKGIAEGVGFKEYDIEYAFGIYPDEEEWVPLQSSSSPANGVLASLDASTLPEGLYSIHLRVNASGFMYQDIVLIVVNNKANTFYVDGQNILGPWDGTQEHPFTSIQYALECCGNVHDEIFVSPGIYKEALSLGSGIFYSKLATRMLGKIVAIRGADKNSTILDGYGVLGCGLNLYSARFITFTGFTVRNFSAGVSTQFSRFNRIFDNSIINNSIIMFLQYSHFNFIYQNNFINNTGNFSNGDTTILESDNMIFGINSVNIWYNPIKLQGNYWDNYQEQYPDASPRFLLSWTWNIPYKIGGFFTNAEEYKPPAILRFIWNNDRFPLVHPL